MHLICRSRPPGLPLNISFILPVCCSLTKVTDLSVHILIDETANDPFVLVPAINAIGTFLSTLHQKQKQAHAVSHCLTLSLSGSWEPHSRVWKALGDLTTLSKLSIHADESQWEACGISMQRLSALAPLGSGLQFLDVLTGRLHAQQDYSFLGSLTALTGAVLGTTAAPAGASTAGTVLRYIVNLAAQFDASFPWLCIKARVHHPWLHQCMPAHDTANAVRFTPQLAEHHIVPASALAFVHVHRTTAALDRAGAWGSTMLSGG